ncbi:DUF4303 domain-containing protein [Empedobacter tilapiae]|uniref:DUF4303 domain-containing protein n=1 Tax=Empedobacter tilapiae TaxID=2491114 RepID=UPI0028D0C6F5|nr:DUF4303 domain-containing protein [Empedobacter tilapiae]
MKTLQPLKERIKTNLKKAFLDIKSQINEERLYIFALGRVEDIEGQYFCTAATLKELKTNFENDSTYYSTFWDASELELSADYNDINYDELKNYLDYSTESEYNQLREEYDQILIDSLTELKNEGLFDNEIPEFSVFVQYVDEGFDIENSSYTAINGTEFLEKFKNRFDKKDDSLTEILIKKYN